MRRSERLAIRVSPRERKLLEAAADHAGATLSAYCRRRLTERAADDVLPRSLRAQDDDVEAESS